MKLHFGNIHKGNICFSTGTTSRKDEDGQRIVEEWWVVRQVRQVFGVSTGSRFFGLMTFEPPSQEKIRVK